ncbi:MAG: TraX family protein [Bacillota bacterium]|jgi:hypothetical protein
MNNAIGIPQQQMLGFKAFDIKVLACIFMFIDHLGYFIFPDLIVLRMIGRLAFPLFAFMIANGYYFTKNRLKYLLRLFIFGLIIQIPYWLFFEGTVLNIFFTLSLGLAAIWLWDSNKKYGSAVVLVATCALMAQVINADYGAYGVLLIFFSYLFFNNMPKLILSWAIINIITLIVQYFFAPLAAINYITYIQILSLFSLFFIKYYNRKEGRKAPWLFYIFYPAHLSALYLISHLL